MNLRISEIKAKKFRNISQTLEKQLIEKESKTEMTDQNTNRIEKSRQFESQD